VLCLAFIHELVINDLPGDRRLPVMGVPLVVEATFDVPSVLRRRWVPVRWDRRLSIAEAVLGVDACVIHWRPVSLLPPSPTIQGRMKHKHAAIRYMTDRLHKYRLNGEEKRTEQQIFEQIKSNNGYEILTIKQPNKLRHTNNTANTKNSWAKFT
jgi:hypothetical protein